MPKEKKIYSVSQITTFIQSLFKENPVFQNLRLKGEISNFRPHSSGHIYFTLKDSGASIGAVMFRSSARRLEFKPKEGAKVIASGEITVYPPHGKYQMQVRSMHPEGWGELHIEFLKRKEKLAREGLFDSCHKKSIPCFPRRIGIVTSPTGAALQDILSVLGRRYPMVRVYLYPALCQGDQAPPRLCEGLKHFKQMDDPVDLVIIGRGGGSIEDLWAFNDETLARNIFDMDIPVISAVGHEIDFTLCDFVADLRAATPTEAAELAVPDREEILSRFREWLNRSESAIHKRITSEQLRLEKIYRGLSVHHPLNRVKTLIQIKDEYFTRMTREIENRIRFRKQVIASLRKRLAASSPFRRLAERKTALRLFHDRMKITMKTRKHVFGQNLLSFRRRLDALNPHSVLKRGYSITLDKDRKAIRAARDTRKGAEVEILLHEGSLNCEVKSTRAGANIYDR